MRDAKRHDWPRLQQQQPPSISGFYLCSLFTPRCIISRQRQPLSFSFLPHDLFSANAKKLATTFPGTRNTGFPAAHLAFLAAILPCYQIARHSPNTPFRFSPCLICSLTSCHCCIQSVSPLFHAFSPYSLVPGNLLNTLKGSCNEKYLARSTVPVRYRTGYGIDGVLKTQLRYISMHRKAWN